MDGNINLHDGIVERIEKQDQKGSILLTLLKPGTVVVVHTKHSVYNIEIIDGTTVFIEGGKRWPQATLARINGSTWGTRMLWCDRIGHEMHMEIVAEGRIVVTSEVRQASIVSPDGWHYDMEWSSSSDLCKA